MARDFIAQESERILVTGASGFIGAKVVEILLEYGFRNLCCFVRPSSRLDRLKAVIRKFAADGTVDLVSGDLVSREDCARAAEGVSIVYHLAAGFDKSFAGVEQWVPIFAQDLEAAGFKTEINGMETTAAIEYYNRGDKRMQGGGGMHPPCATAGC